MPSHGGCGETHVHLSGHDEWRGQCAAFLGSPATSPPPTRPHASGADSFRLALLRVLCRSECSETADSQQLHKPTNKNRSNRPVSDKVTCFLRSVSDPITQTRDKTCLGTHVILYHYVRQQTGIDMKSPGRSERTDSNLDLKGAREVEYRTKTQGTELWDCCGTGASSRGATSVDDAVAPGSLLNCLGYMAT